MKNPHFLKIAGVPVLDFTNSWIKHSSHIEERLSSPQQAESFFKDIFHEKVTVGQLDYKKILIRRRQLRNLFEHLTTHCSFDDVSTFWPFNKMYRTKIQLLSTPSLPENKKKRRFRLVLGKHFESVLLNQTLEFLERLDLQRLKKCQNQNCSHFFYDSSKSGMRSWCSMKTCGNLAKVQKFRKKSK